MSSMFSFFREPGEEPAPELPEGESPEQPRLPRPAASAGAFRAAATALTQADFEAVLDGLRAALEAYLPPAGAPPLPAHRVDVASFAEAPLSIGNRRGVERRGPFALAELKGGRLEARVRFQVWGSDADQADLEMSRLQANLLAARNELWGLGILRIAADEVELALEDTNASAWQRTAYYQLLYEYHFEDADGAQSLITRIPVHHDPEVLNSLQRETMVITGRVARWDNESAPPLVLRGPLHLSALAVLDYLPTAQNPQAVTVLRSTQGAWGSPPAYPDLEAFLAALQDPFHPVRRARLVYPSIDDFLADFAAPQAAIELGDWDEDDQLDAYTSRLLVFSPALVLPTRADLLTISLGGSALDPSGVMYLGIVRLS